MRKYFAKTISFILVVFLMSGHSLYAQTDMDAIMMNKNAFCVGPMYTYSSWKNYWEGTLKRENLNIGKVTTETFSIMGNYGLSKKVNLLFNVPYVKTKASAGTLQGMSGLQDLSLFVKWMPFRKFVGPGRLSFFGIAGASHPMSNYTPDFLPLSIGLHAPTASARVMADYQIKSLFVSGSATYVLRDNIKIDRGSYYTTEMHYSNEVEMPDGANFNLRMGLRNSWLIAEAVLNSWRSLDGFDITRNNMPFPSNKMNATTLGVNVKYVMPFLPELSIVAGGNATLAGRNMGQASTAYGSLFYVFDFRRKPDANDQSQTDKNN